MFAIIYYASVVYRLNGTLASITRDILCPPEPVWSGASTDKREAVLYQWYRQQLRRQVPPLIARWEPEIGVTVTEWRIKNMKTRWGTCNIEARRIWLNLQLAKKTVSCLEYIVVHEMVHLLERLHNERFRELMDRFMPQWRLHRDELNQFPLAHEGWQY